MITAKNGRQEVWVLTSSFQKFMTSNMNSKELNFRILAGYADELVRGTKCNGPSLLDRNGGYEPPLFAKWRSWHRGEFDASSHLQALTSVRWHKYPNFFTHYHRSSSPVTPSYSFSRIFTKPFFFFPRIPWTTSTRSIYNHRPVDYSIFIDHSWRTRDTIRTLMFPSCEEQFLPVIFSRCDKIYQLEKLWSYSWCQLNFKVRTYSSLFCVLWYIWFIRNNHYHR